MPASFTYPTGDHFENIPNAKLTWVKFTPIPSSGSSTEFSSITLYMPPNFSVNDSGQYNNFDLGKIGNVADSVINDIISGNLTDSAKRVLDTFSDKDNVGSLLPSALTMLMPSNSSIRNFTDYQRKKVQNPHTVTNFSRVNIRKFNFAFRMIATSSTEADHIKQMTEFVRQCVYPTNDSANLGFLQKFPPTWKIEFLYGSINDLAENSNLPVIHECFLESCQTTYNAESNAWHADGQPIDISMSLSFSETKPYDSETINSRSYDLDPAVNNQLEAVNNAISRETVTEELLDDLSERVVEAETEYFSLLDNYSSVAERFEKGEVDETTLNQNLTELQNQLGLFSTLSDQEANAKKTFLAQANNPQ